MSKVPKMDSTHQDDSELFFYGLQSSSESDFTDGHAWISVTDAEGNVTNYGLWPDEHPATVNNGNGSDVRVGLENGAVSVASKYFDLTVDQNTKLNTFLGTSAEWGEQHRGKTQDTQL